MTSNRILSTSRTTLLLGALVSGAGALFGADASGTPAPAASSAAAPDAAAAPLPADKTKTGIKDGPTSVLNRRLPRWLRLGGQIRTRGEGRTAFGFVEGNNDAYGLTRFRLNVDIKPTSWMQMLVQGQDSQVHGIDESRKNVPIFRNPADIRQAYVYFKNREDGVGGVKAGRQLLIHGSSIGESGC